MKAYIALGANLGEPVQTLRQALDAISHMSGVTVTGKSSLYRTAPVDSSGPDYVNAVIRVETTLKSEELLKHLLRLEKFFGRVRPAGVINAPRTLDLDLLLCGRLVRQTEILTLPHPRMHQRAFVLVPLTEIDPDIEIPGLGPAASFLEAVRDQSIEKIPDSF